MEFTKRITISFLVLVVLGISFRGYLYRQLFTYKSLGVRADYRITNGKLKDYINSKAENQKDLKIEKIIELSLSITSKHLNFTDNKNDIDPNKLIISRTAHCVGYSVFFATTCNYLLKQYNLNKSWRAKTQIGQIYFLRTNMHKYFDSSFFKDHDFVIIENNLTGEVFAVDPTVNDYLRISFVTYLK